MGNILGPGFAKSINTSLTEALGGNGLTAKFRERGVQLGEALSEGIRSAMKIPSLVPASGAPAASGGSGGSGGSIVGSGVHRSSGGDSLSTLITGGVVGHMAARAGESLFENAGALAQIRAQLGSQGMNDAEVKDIEDVVRPISAKYRATSVTRLLQQYGEYRTVFANPEDAKAFLPIGAQVDLGLRNLQSAENWAKSIDPEQAQLEIAKAVEMKGDAMNPAKARADVDSMLKAIAAFKGQITTGDFLTAFKYARGCLRGFSDDFLFTVLPTLMAEFKSRGGQASGAGTALQSFYRTVLKGQLGKAKGEWQRLGLLDKHGRPIDLDLARENPLTWWQKDVAPKLAGMSPQRQKDEIARLFPTAIPEQMATIFQNDAQRLAKDAENINKALVSTSFKKTSPTRRRRRWPNSLHSFTTGSPPSAIR